MSRSEVPDTGTQHTRAGKPGKDPMEQGVGPEVFLVAMQPTSALTVGLACMEFFLLQLVRSLVVQYA